MFKITKFGPGYTQEHTFRDHESPILVGELGIVVSDPSKVLLRAGSQKFVLHRIPGPGPDGVMYYLGNGSHGRTPFGGQGIDKRLVEHLVTHQGKEIEFQFENLRTVKDCRPAQDKVEKWLYQHTILTWFPSEDGVNPSGPPFFTRDGKQVAP